MLDHNFHQKYNEALAQLDNKARLAAYKQADLYYRKMCFRGCLWRLWRRLTHKPVELMDFDSFTHGTPIQNSFDAGIKTVQIEKIIGTVSKKNMFDANLNLKSDHKSWAQRWKRILKCYLLDEEIPSVELIQVNENYFIKDGHHRISTARLLGRQFIEAQVNVVKFAAQPEGGA